MNLRDLIITIKTKFDKSGVASAEKSLDGAAKKGAKSALSLEDAWKNVATAAKLAMGAGVIGYLKGLVDSTVTAADEIGDMSERVGLSATEFQAWKKAAGAFDVDVKALSLGLRALQKGLVSVNGGAGSSAKVLQQLGVSAKDAAGNTKDASVLAQEALITISEMEDEGQQLPRLMQLFGRSGNMFLPMVAAGAETIREKFAEAKEEGAIFSEEFIKQSDKAEKLQRKLKGSLTKLKAALVSAVLPGFNQTSEAGANLAKWFAKLASQGKILQTVITLVGINFAALKLKDHISSVGGARKAWAAFGKTLSGTLRTLATFALLALLIEDIVVWVKGGDSAFGSFLDTMLGTGTSVAMLKDLKTIVAGLAPSFQGLTQILRDITNGTLTAVLAIGGMLSANESVAERSAALFMKASQGLGAFFDEVFEFVFDKVRAVHGAIVEFAGNTIQLTARLLQMLSKIPGVGDVIAPVASGAENLGLAVSAAGTRFARSSADVRAQAEAENRSFHEQKTLNVNDQRTVTINVTGAPSPQEAGAKVGRLADQFLGNDTRRMADMLLGVK